MTWFSFANWLKRTKRQSTCVPRIGRRINRSQKLRFRPRLEDLEGRNLPSTISLVPGEPAPQLVGEPITWTATVSNEPAAGLVYQFSDGLLDGSFRVARDFSPSNTFTWAPMEEGEYKIKVTVMQGFAATDAESAVVHDVVNSRVPGLDAVVTPTSDPLVALYSAPPLSEDVPRDELMHVEFSLAGPNQSWRSTNELPVEEGKSTNFLVAGMLPNTTYEMRHVLEDGTASAPLFFTTGSLPANLAFPTFTVRQTPPPGTAQDQDMIFHQFGSAPSNVPNPLATDLTGHVTWYYDVSQSGLTHTFPGQSLVPGGTVLVLGVDRYAPSPGTLDVLREIDLAGDVVRETNIDAVNAQLTALGFNPVFSFTHDVQRLPNGQTAVIGSTERTININGTPTEYVGMTIIMLDKNFQVSWAWDAFDHLDVNRGPVLGEVLHAGDPDQVAQSTPILPAVDWLHINAVSWSPADGNLIVSVRHQDWVLKIAYENGAGDGHIVWRLGQGGDFTVNSTDPNPWFSHQHDAHLIDASTLIVFDNGNTRRAGDPTANSRGQVWKLDESAMTATLVVNVDLGSYSPMFGSAQRLLNGDYVFTSGAQGKAPNLIGQSIEVRPDGTKVYVLEANRPEFRTFRIQTLYSGISDNPPAPAGGTRQLDIPANPTLPNTLNVTSAADSGTGSLRDTIAAAQNGDTIVFDSSLDGQTITLTSGELAIDKSLDIEGPGADQLTISGNGTSRVFDLTDPGADVTITGLMVAGGRAARGAGIDNHGTLAITDSVLAENQAIGAAGFNGQGGGIENEPGATLQVSNSIFVDNLAQGGGADSAGNAGLGLGGGAYNEGIGTVSDSTFLGNQATGGDSAPGSQGGNGMGGALGNAATLAVSDSTFTGNHALGGLHGRAGVYPFVGAGGGAAIENEANLTVDDSIFADNQSFGGQGGAGVAGGNGNAAAILSDGAALAPGQTGAPASVTVSHGTFLDNQATGGPGGAGAAGGGGNGGAILTTFTTFTITDSTFRGNQATGGTGGAGGAGGVGRGGAIYQSARDGDATFLISHSRLVDNRAVGGAGGTGGVAGMGLGGAIENLDNTKTPGLHTANLTIDHCRVADNEARGGDGGMGGDGAGGGIANQDGAVLTVSDTLLMGNLARGGNGGPGDNGGNGLGGGLYVSGGTESVLATIIVRNQALGGDDAAGGSDGQGVGGGIYIAAGASACSDNATVIGGNSASTSNDDVFGVLEIC